jgi:polar amino acid transport system substrate-binding protein
VNSRRVTSLTVFSALVLALATAVGCGSPSSDASNASQDALGPVPTTTTAPPDKLVDDPACRDRPTESFMPSELYRPGEMPEDTTMHEIQESDQLVVGVDENTDRFAARDPRGGEIKGLEVDLVRDIAEAITGSREKVKFRTVLTADKNRVVADGKVDLTASAISMTCKRWSQVAFSTEYFTAAHKLMVRESSGINGVADLSDRTVCVTEGSSSVDLLEEVAPDARMLAVPGRTDCLVALQEGEADAYLAHDTFLRAMHEQDPLNTVILPEMISTQHYGIAIPKENTDLVRFVNAVLQQMRENERLEFLYDWWLGDDHPPIPDPDYRDEDGSG